MASEKPLVYYDIILHPKAYPSAPNPWKARYVLNYARVPYRTSWTPLNAIPSTRVTLGAAPVRKHADGSDYPTLPVLHDPTTGLVYGDSFDIAVHVNDAYLPADRKLIPDGTLGLHRAFNAHADALFTQYAAFMGGPYMTFDPVTGDDDKKGMLARMPVKLDKKDWEDLKILPGSDLRNKLLVEFEAALDKLATSFPGPGPFMDGQETPVYADLIVGGWLQFTRGTMLEWEEIRDKWSGGRWGRLLDALREWEVVDGREEGLVLGVMPSGN